MGTGDYEDGPAKSEDAISGRPRLIVGICAGLIYGLLVRVAFGLDTQRELLNTLTWGFLTFVPLALGALTVYFSGKVKRGSSSAFFLPWVTSAIFLGVVTILAWEAMLCIWMASPFFFVVAGIGGVLMRFIMRVQITLLPGYVLPVLMIAPFVTSPLEAGLARPDSFRTVENDIIIQASPDIIWDEIVRVPQIQPHERRLTWFQMLGIPQPVEATMDFDGAGGLRHSTYENGMAFNEMVLDWQPQERLRFTIVPDHTAPLPMPFDEIGGRYFELVDGTYRLEPLGDGLVRLHLSSTHRLSTSFNGYGGLWMDFILRDLQQYILEIVKGRAEARAGAG
jgi:hypothetical protein